MDFPPPPPQLSPDGRFYWDGTAWRPCPAGPSGGPPVVAAIGALGPRKHAFGYWFASFVITGLGTMLAGAFLRGLALFLLEGVLGAGVWILSASGMQLTRAPGGTVTVLVLNQGALVAAVVCALAAVIVWICGMVDAVRSVYAWNRTHGYTY
jgi:hypothetical protein